MIAGTNGESTSDSEPDFVIYVLGQMFGPWMGDYFKPWRRKIGVVTLGLTCVFAMAWIRSIQFDEAIGFNGLGRRQVFRSVEGHFIWYSQALRLSEMASWSLNARWLSVPIEKTSSGNSSPNKDLIRRCPMPYGFRYTFWFVPCWSIVIPLTLLSAYLLLSKPRVLAPKKSKDPKPAEGT